MNGRWFPFLCVPFTVGVTATALLVAPMPILRRPSTSSGQAATTGGEQVPRTGDDKKDSKRPIETTNCVRCHLTAGRELTAPVGYFAGSVHDRARMSCNDCHGGNTDDDTSAHEAEFGFIGTKLSAHMSACADCHAEEFAVFRKGAHFWDLTQRINRDYPVCIDCHGNHDVGKPPADFSLAAVCTDCHKKWGEEHAAISSVVSENDRLWTTLRRVQAKRPAAVELLPGSIRSELSRVRRATARQLHSTGAVSDAEAAALNARVKRLREQIESWLESAE